MTAEQPQKKPSPSRDALRVRARAKGKKPAFLRAESWKYDRFSLSWRKPRGLDNKIRRKIKGWPPGPSAGYKGPKVARYLHPSGYKEVLVYNAENLADIDPNTQAVRIAHTVGKRKRASIIAKAKELNLKILNVKVSKETETEEGKEAGEEGVGEETEEKAEAEKTEKKEEETEIMEEVKETTESAEEEPKEGKLKPKKARAPRKQKSKSKKGEEE